MYVLVQPTSTSHPRQSKIKGTNQKVFYNIIFFTFLSLDTQHLRCSAIHGWDERIDTREQVKLWFSVF